MTNMRSNPEKYESFYCNAENAKMFTLISFIGYFMASVAILFNAHSVKADQSCSIGEAMVSAEALNVRENPGQKPVIAKIFQGQNVTIQRCSGSWGFVQGLGGWIHTGYVKYNGSTADDEEKKGIIEHGVVFLKNVLKDGQSARIRNLRMNSQDTDSALVCGEVNAKNAFGAYTGYKPFSVEYKYRNNPCASGCTREDLVMNADIDVDILDTNPDSMQELAENRALVCAVESN